MKRVSLRGITVAFGLVLLASCNGSSSGNGFIGNLPGPPVQPSFSRMFDGQTGTSKISIIAAPFAPPLTPAAAFNFSSNLGQLAFNPSNGALAASGGTCNPAVAIFNPPYSSSTVPVVTMGGSAISCPGGVAWDGSGNLWVANLSPGGVFEFVPPFTASPVPAATNTTAAFPAGLAINPAAGLMFIADELGTPSHHVYVIPAPYTGVPTATLSTGSNTPVPVAVDQLGRLFVGYVTGPLFGKIQVFTPPYATGNAPVFTLDAGASVFSLGFDSAQNLYAQRQDGSVVVFNGPILGSFIAPSAVLGCPSGACSGAGGLAFGP